MSDSDTVTIERSHLETLMRRANLHGSEPSNHHESQVESVTVPKDYLEDLKRSLREYTNLRNALLRGGVAPESLELLIQEQFDDPEPAGIIGRNRYQLNRSIVSTDAGVPLFDSTHAVTPLPIRPSAETQFGYHPPGRDRTWNFNGPVSFNSPHKHEHGAHEVSYGQGNQYPGHPYQKSWEQHHEINFDGNSHGKRTLYLTKLPERLTYAKVFDVIRGGAVVDLWMKPSDHAASVSFVECAAAEEFYQYSKKNDIYIDGKRIQVEWREPARQFVILNNIMSAISRGATRNLVLQKIPPSLTAARIRDDLDHIHNLHVVKVDIRGSSAYVNLNSICVALFARTCLMSRTSYKGVKIEFAEDECTMKIPAVRKQTEQKKENQPRAVPKNIFDVLATEETEEDSSDETERETSDRDGCRNSSNGVDDSSHGVKSHVWGGMLNGFN